MNILELFTCVIHSCRILKKMIIIVLISYHISCFCSEIHFFPLVLFWEYLNEEKGLQYFEMFTRHWIALSDSLVIFYWKMLLCYFICFWVWINQMKKEKWSSQSSLIASKNYNTEQKTEYLGFEKVYISLYLSSVRDWNMKTCSIPFVA